MYSEYDLYILNEQNIPITSDYINSIFSKYNVNYSIKSLSYFQNAMVHTSYLKRDPEYWSSMKTKNTNQNLDKIPDPTLAIPLQTESNERLEFLGDSVLKLVIAQYLFQRYPNENEGFMTKLRTKLENGDTLSILGKIIGLDKYVLISRYIEKNNGRVNNFQIIEDAFEAFIGALLLDGSFDICNTFIRNLIESKIDFSNLLKEETNYKDELLRVFHKYRWQDPTYHVQNINGPENKRVFTMFIKKRVLKSDNGVVLASGWGYSKKRAEQDAAYNALVTLGVIKKEVNYASEEEEEECV